MQFVLPDSIITDMSETGSVDDTFLAFASPEWKAWPTVASITKLASTKSPIALTFNSNVAVVQSMIASLHDLPRDFSAAAVYTNDSVPVELLAKIPPILHRFLRRLLPEDMLAIASVSSWKPNVNASWLDAFLKFDAESVALPGACNPDRFPAAGPEHSIIRTDEFLPAVQAAADLLKLSSAARRCIESGILLLWDFLDESHEISQTMEGKGSPRTADYWHAIMHRREPDAGNASYWFRRVGSHPAFDVLTDKLILWMSELGATESQKSLARSKVLPKGPFDPFGMVEFSTAAIRNPSTELNNTFRMVQYLEILNLLAWTCSHSACTV